MMDYRSISKSIHRWFLLFIASITSCITPLYEKAEVGNRWVGNAGFCYINLTMPFTSFGDGCAFNPSHHYSNFQIFRCDAFGGYAIKNRFGIGVRGAFEICSEDDLLSSSRSRETFPMPDLGIWSKLNIYSNSDLCFSVKYDAGLNNLETGGNLYFMFGIKAKEIERLTISIFTSPAKQYELENVITGSGLFLSVHNVPILHRTVMIGSNFFFSQNLGEEEEHFIVFYAGIGI